MCTQEGLGHCEEVTRAVGTLESVHSPGITKEVEVGCRIGSCLLCLALDTDFNHFSVDAHKDVRY